MAIQFTLGPSLYLRVLAYFQSKMPQFISEQGCGRSDKCCANESFHTCLLGADSKSTKWIWIAGSSGRRSEREWRRELSGIMVALTGFEPVFPP